jgi:Cytochrome c oxidase subunit IV
MTTLSRIFLALGAFLFVASGAYAWHAKDFEGVALELSVMAGVALTGGFGLLVVRRTTNQLVGQPEEPPGTAADDEPHVGPTIWPLVFALSGAVLVVGILVTRWALVAGAVVFVAAAAGWIHDVYRQWRHHAHARPHATAGTHIPQQGGAHDGAGV